MQRQPGPICAERLGDAWIDHGTTAHTRMPAPGAVSVVPLATRPPAPRLATTASTTLETKRMLLRVLDTAGIVDTNERAMFLAQLAHESKDFTHLRENLHYSAAKLVEVFPTKFKTLTAAQAVVDAGPAAIAERLYGYRKRLGNIHPGDGAKYIGRGFIQLTGRANYQAAGAALNLDLVNHPELAESPEVAARVAVWFWQTRRIGALARAGDVTETTFRINGGKIGLHDRARRYRHYLKDPEVPVAKGNATPPGPQPRVRLP